MIPVKRFRLVVAPIFLGLTVLIGCSSGVDTPTPGIAGAQSGSSTQAGQSADQVLAKAKSASKTVTVRPAGGKVALPAFGGFTGDLTYAGNDAAAKTTLTLTNTGKVNLLKAPTPLHVSPSLFLEAALDGKGIVTFDFSAAKSTLDSSELVKTKSYTYYLYEIGEKAEIGKVVVGPATAPGKLTFSSPLANRNLSPKHALVIELAAGPIPTPKPTPTPKATATPSPSPTPSMTPPPTPTPGPLSVTPGTLTFNAATTQTFTAQESNYIGLLTAVSSNTSVATVGPSSQNGPSASFVVTPVGGGEAQITVTDASGNQSVVQVYVNNEIIIIDRAHTHGGVHS